MYLVEPLLNSLLRKKMGSVLDFDKVRAFAVPEKEQTDREDYLLYVHIPFCESLCPYCSFHRYVFEKNLADKYFDALWKELRMYKDAGYDFKALYIGGGTPTIDINRLADTLGLIKSMFSIREISVETNPNHLTDKNMSVLKKAAVNRLSVGVQSFDDDILKQIGRYEKYGSSRKIQEKLEGAVNIFDTLNIDLIFNIPLQSRKSLESDIDILDSLLAQQVTFYPLMAAKSVENTLKKSVGPVRYRKEKSFYFTILERMKRNYTGSTAWCFSRKKSMIDEYIVTYNKYIGVGSGAFGYFNDSIYANTFSLDEYVQKVGSGQFPVGRVRKFSRRENMHYFLLMKLFGLQMSKEEFKTRFGKSYEKALFLESRILRLAGATTESETGVNITDRGRYLWVMAMREFFVAVDTLRDHCREAASHRS